VYQIRIKLAQTATLAVAVLLSPISCCDVVAAFKMAAVARQNGARQRESAAAINVSLQIGKRWQGGKPQFRLVKNTLKR